MTILSPLRLPVPPRSRWRVVQGFGRCGQPVVNLFRGDPSKGLEIANMMELLTGAALLLLLVVVLLNILGLTDILELVASVVKLAMALVALVLTGFAWIIRKATRLMNSKKGDDPETNDRPPG